MLSKEGDWRTEAREACELSLPRIRIVTDGSCRPRWREASVRDRVLGHEEGSVLAFHISLWPCSLGLADSGYLLTTHRDREQAAGSEMTYPTARSCPADTFAISPSADLY